MMPLREIDANLESLNRSQYLNALFMFFVMTTFVGIFIWIVVNIPVHKLTIGTQEITKGNLEYRISARSSDEIGRLATSFNQMADELKRARNDLTQWAQTLEGRVAQKTEELRRAHANMVQMEKMVSLGKLASTVAHELNNPLEGVLTVRQTSQEDGERRCTNAGDGGRNSKRTFDYRGRDRPMRNIVKNLLLFSKQKVGEFVETDIRTTIERS